MTGSPFDRLMPDQLRANAIRENETTLGNCAVHIFEVPEEAFIKDGQGANVGIFPGTKFRCIRCGGRLPALEAFRYAEGYAAAGSDPNEIIPGFR